MAIRGKAGWTEAVGEAPSRRSGERPDEAREGSPDWPENGREFEAIMFGRGVFLKGKNFNSIRIVAPPQVSNFIMFSKS
jgi:hypothetical protein